MRSEATTTTSQTPRPPNPYAMRRPAVVFLFTPTTQLAAISVLLLEDRGATNQAAAFSCSIMAIVIASLLLAHLLLRLLGARNASLIR